MWHIMLWGLNEVTPVKPLGQIMTQSWSSVDGRAAGGHNEGRGKEKEDDKLESAMVVEIRFHGKFKEPPKIEG